MLLENSWNDFFKVRCVFSIRDRLIQKAATWMFVSVCYVYTEFVEKYILWKQKQKYYCKINSFL